MSRSAAGGVDTRQTFYTGGGSGEFAPFAAAIAFDYVPNIGRGAVELLVKSAEDGSTSEATVVPVKFTAPKPSGAAAFPAERSELKTNASVVHYRNGAQVGLGRRVRRG